MPFVEKDRWTLLGYDHRVCSHDGSVRIVVEPADATASLQRSLRLANALRSVDEDRGEVRKDLVQLVVDNPTYVSSSEPRPAWHAGALPYLHATLFHRCTPSLTDPTARLAVTLHAAPAALRPPRGGPDPHILGSLVVGGGVEFDARSLDPDPPISTTPSVIRSEQRFRSAWRSARWATYFYARCAGAVPMSPTSSTTS